MTTLGKGIVVAVVAASDEPLETRVAAEVTQVQAKVLAPVLHKSRADGEPVLELRMNSLATLLFQNSKLGKSIAKHVSRQKIEVVLFVPEKRKY